MEWYECAEDDAAAAADRETRRLDDAERAIDSTWSVAGLYDAHHVVLAAVGIDKLTRYLAHATLPCRAQESGLSRRELYRLISALRSGVSRLEQVIVQIGDRAQRASADADPTVETAALVKNLDSAAQRICDVAATMADAQRSAARIQ